MMGRIPVNVQMKACGRFQILFTGLWKPAEGKGIVPPKIIIFVIYSALCGFDPACPSFFFRPQKDTLVYIMAVYGNKHQPFFLIDAERSHVTHAAYSKC